MKSFISTMLISLSLFSAMDSVLLYHQGEVIDEVDKTDYQLIPNQTGLLDTYQINNLMKRVNERVTKSAENAIITDQGEIEKEILGATLDKKIFKQKLYQYFVTNEPLKIEIPVKRTYPRVTSELLARIYQQKLASYETYYNESDENRSHNIKLAAKAIHNHVVFPTDEFSFNNIVGERTDEKGYKRAPVIMEGELTEDLGGGICQVSSTLYNAVHLRGIQIQERYSHSKPVPYVPPGKDATVSWWGPDFSFKNIYNEPVLIQASAKDGKLTISIYSAEMIQIQKKSTED